jgi:elongation factor G
MGMASGLDLKRVRNIGIIAHIDAGKTTTTERILYYTGATRVPGDVDEGTTTTDYLKDEQDRGITIVAAAVRCEWKSKNILINIIDTPGHVDFTAEVERSLRVLDGGVVVFSGMEGVEAQSETVWHQADRYKVPRVCFINKLDRIGADFYRVYDEIVQRLGAKPIPLQIPVGVEKDFRGVIDLIERKYLTFDESTQGKEFFTHPVPEELETDVEVWRDKLLEAIADVDDGIAEAFLEGREIPSADIRAAIRKATLQHGMTPIMCGSSLKYIGVQPILDAVADYLPSPLDIPPVAGINLRNKPETRPASPDAPFCGLVFKIQASQHDELAFVRIYSGTLKPATRVLNATRDKKENITRLLHIQADRRTQLEAASAGDIVGVVGLKNSFTGDTLCDQKAPIILERIAFPETVVSMSIEPESSADKQKLADVLAIMQKEDPTFRVIVSPETGETLMSGMGELHLEIIRNKMVRDHKVPLRIGKPRVSYRETLQKPVTIEAECNRQMPASKLFVKLTIAFSPIPTVGAGTTKIPFRFLRTWEDEEVPGEFFTLVEQALREECTAGGLSGYPLTGIEAKLINGTYVEGESNEQAVRIACSQAVHDALKKGGIDILEPIMKLDVTTPEEYMGSITADLGARRAMIDNTGMRGLLRTITAQVPIREMFGYTTTLRSLSQGRATYAMEPADYAIAPREVTQSIL